MRSDLNSCVAMYCDGGLAGQNPSRIGGSWACCFVGFNDELILSASGFVSMADAGQPVSNNYTELLSSIEGMERLPFGWAGTIYSDSQVTLSRLRKKASKMAGIPKAMQERFYDARSSLGKVHYAYVLGHPTKLDLKLGRGSKWNVLCDKLCTEAMR